MASTLKDWGIMGSIFFLIVGFVGYEYWTTKRLSSGFRAAAIEALDSIDRLEKEHLAGLVVHEPRRLEAEKAVAAATRLAENLPEVEASNSIELYAHRVHHCRQLAQFASRGVVSDGDYRNCLFELQKLKQAAHRHFCKE